MLAAGGLHGLRKLGGMRGRQHHHGHRRIARLLLRHGERHRGVRIDAIAGLAQRHQLLRDVRLTFVQRGFHVADANLAIAQHIEDLCFHIYKLGFSCFRRRPETEVYKFLYFGSLT